MKMKNQGEDPKPHAFKGEKIHLYYPNTVLRSRKQKLDRVGYPFFQKLPLIISLVFLVPSQL